MKRLIPLVLLAFHPLYSEPLNVKVNAEAAILMNADTGKILYEKNAHELHYPASITKVATAAYALKKKGNELNAKVVAEQESIASITAEAKKRANYSLPSYWVEQGSSHIGIKKGEELTFRDLLYGMLVPSGNDAANCIAQYTSGSIPAFMTELNIYLKDIGCKNTTFYNPHGLHHPNHQTTAYDMAIIAREALKNPTFREVVATVRYTRPKTNKQESTTLVQTNRMIRSGRYFYPKAIGVKTGQTAAAMNTFVSAAKDNDRTLIAVLLKTKERNDVFLDSAKLFEAAFNQPKVQRTVLRAGPQKYELALKGAASPVKTYLKEDVTVEYYPAEEPKLKCLLYWDTNLTAPIAKDQQVGHLKLMAENDYVLKTIPLYSPTEVKITWASWFKSFF
jgi:D-alanyl-D-alanine carboxypeptidase (penicillin-binding protein 5/6)